MFFVGALIVIVSVLGGYICLGGRLVVLWQPFEAVIIVGAALGALVIANPINKIKKIFSAFGLLISPKHVTQKDFVELLSVLYQIFRVARVKGELALEMHIEKPSESPVFSLYQSFLKNKRAVTFLCDSLRLLTLGMNDPHQIDVLMEEEIDTHKSEELEIPSAIASMADGMPALGIVAAVLGMIKTMGAMAESPEVLGKLIGAAFVGTFLGVLLAYGFVTPIGNFVKAICDEKVKYLECIKIAILAHISGNSPIISIEFARRSLTQEVRPTFQEVEQTVSTLPSVT